MERLLEAPLCSGDNMLQREINIKVESHYSTCNIVEGVAGDGSMEDSRLCALR